MRRIIISKSKVELLVTLGNYSIVLNTSWWISFIFSSWHCTVSCTLSFSFLLLYCYFNPGIEISEKWIQSSIKLHSVLLITVYSVQCSEYPRSLVYITHTEAAKIRMLSRSILPADWKCPFFPSVCLWLPGKFRDNWFIFIYIYISYLSSRSDLNFFNCMLSWVSGTSLLGFTEEIYVFGTQILTALIPEVLVCLTSIFAFLPVFYRLEVSSSYEV